MAEFKKPKFAKKSFAEKFRGGARPARPMGGYTSNRPERPTELHQATCNECGKMCEVPFRPNGKKPVYCRDCFRREDGTTRTDTPSRTSYARATPSYDRPSRSPEASSSNDLAKQVSLLVTKIDRLISAIENKG